MICAEVDKSPRARTAAVPIQKLKNFQNPPIITAKREQRAFIVQLFLILSSCTLPVGKKIIIAGLRAFSFGHLKSVKSSENSRLRKEKFQLPKERES